MGNWLNNCKSYSPAGDEFLMGLRNIHQEREEKKIIWIDKLMLMDVKAAHPDDGWVDRKSNKVHFAYPFFNHLPKEGDLIALGNFEEFRLVRVVQLEPFFGDKYYYWFEELEKTTDSFFKSRMDLFHSIVTGLRIPQIVSWLSKKLPQK